jgi:hypothetical protein
MSAKGQKQTSDWRLLMSALHPKADIAETARTAVACASAKAALFSATMRCASPCSRVPPGTICLSESNNLLCFESKLHSPKR